MPKNWNRRFKHNRDKIKTGDIYELAEVVRNLAVREQEKGLSTGEKQMYTRAKKILASEMRYALEKDEEQTEAYLDELLHRDGSSRLPNAAAAILVAAGSGERLGAARPKAFVELAGRPMIEWSEDALRAAGLAYVRVVPEGFDGVTGGRDAVRVRERRSRRCRRATRWWCTTPRARSSRRRSSAPRWRRWRTRTRRSRPLGSRTP